MSAFRLDRVAFIVGLLVGLLVGCGDDAAVPSDAPLVDDAVEQLDMPLPPATLAITPPSHALGTVTVGETSAAMMFTVTNTGTGPTGALAATLVGTGAASFQLDANTCTTLAANATCTIGVRFSPTAVGAQSASLQVSAAEGGMVTAMVTGVGRGPNSLLISAQTTADFGSVAVGTASASRVFVVTSPASAPMTGAIGATLDNPAFHIIGNTCAGGVLAAGGTCSITVKLLPTVAAASVQGTLAVVASPGDTASIAVSGVAVNQANLVLAPSETLAFDNVFSGQTLERTIAVTNPAGAAPSGPVQFSLSGADMSLFTLQPGSAVANDCAIGGTTELAAGQTCNLRVRFAPNLGFGAKTAAVTISATPGTTTSRVVALKGTSVSTIRMTPSSHHLGNLVVGGSSMHTFTVTNDTASPVTITGTTPPASPYTIMSNTCTGSVATTCTVTVSFAPPALTSYNATLQVDSAHGAAVAQLTGRGISNAAANITITPLGVLGNTAIGASSRYSLLLQNMGQATSGPIVISPITGADAPMFATGGTCASVLLASGATCEITVTFTPTNVGPKSANFTISANPGLAPQVVSLNANAVTNATLGITPSSEQLVGDRVSGVIDPSGTIFNLINGGAVPTGALALVLGDSTNFAIDNAGVANACSAGAGLPANANCNFRVKFNPKSAGNKTTTVTASAAAAPGMSAVGSLRGNGLSALIVSPTDRDFGSVGAGAASGPFTFTFTNRAPIATGLLYTSLAGAHASELSIVTDTCAGQVVAASSTCAITVVFTPNPSGAAGHRDATLSVSGTPGDAASANLDGDVP